MTPKMRWVAPPTWPDFPEGFVPPDDWQPDPSWPAPPTGWQFWQPAPGPVDVHTGLPWWRRRSNINRIAGLALPVIGLVAGILAWTGAFSSNSSSTLNGGALQGQIERWMHRRLGSTDPVASCPRNEPARAGTEFLCTVSDSSGATAHVQVTVINNNGDATWQLIG